MKLLRKIIKAIKNPNLIIEKIDLAQDYLMFMGKYGAFLKKKSNCETNKRLLVVSLSNWIPQVKEEAVLAKALQLRGITPIILTYRRYSLAQKYFRLFGFDQFVYFDDYLKKTETSAFIKESQELLKSKFNSIKSILKLSYKGVNVGNHVLSTFVRSLHKGRVDISAAEIKSYFCEMLPEVMQRTVAARNMLKETNPEILLFNEKAYTSYGPIYDVALSQGKNIIQFVGSHRDDAFTFKRYTPSNTKMHPVSLSQETWELMKSMPWSKEKELELRDELEKHYKSGAWFNRQQLQRNKKMKSREDIQKQLGLDPDKKTAVIFSHILWDATFFYGEDLFDSYGEWLVETVRAACKNPALNWVVKLHPANLWKLGRDQFKGDLAEKILFKQAFGKLPNHIKLMEPNTDINTFSLFDFVDYCLTVRGTIGMEMPCYGIPVITAGTGRYSGQGFTYDSKTREEYLEKIAYLHELPRLDPQQIELAEKHAYALFKLRPFQFQSIDIIYKHDKQAKYLDPRIIPKVKSFEELANAPDLKVFADWVVDSKTADFLISRNK